MSELFLAEAAVRVRADTSGFRATLLAEVESAVRAAEAIAKVRITPIAAGAAGAGAAAGASEQAAASKVAAAAIQEEVIATEELNQVTQQLGATEVEAAAATKTRTMAGQNQAAINSKLAASEASVAASKAEVIGAESAEAAASVQLTAAKRAVAQAAAALTLAQKAENTEAIRAAEIAVQTAVAQRGEAKSALDAARAQAAHAASLSQVGRGAGSTLLTMVGLRGATLAASAPFIAAAASAIAFAKAIQLATSFNTELKTFQVTAGATADEMARVSEAAKQLGNDITLPAVSTADAAQAMTELSKAGLSVQDSIAGARGVLQLATAAQIDNAQATELAASALNAFGLSGDQAVHVADVLANAANDAQGSISDIGQALQQASAVGRQAGLSLEQVTAVLTLFARNGLRGSDAGTSFRTMMIRLINPTQKAQDIINKLGLSLRTATGAINLNVFQQFADATRKVTKAERDRDLAIIFGQDAIRGAAIAAREGTVAINSQIDSLNKYGTAAEVAGARTQGLAGAAENLKNEISNAALAIGLSLTPSLTDIVNVAGTAVSALGKIVGQVVNLQKEAQRPIDFVINVIPQQVGGGEGGALSTIKQDLLDIGTKPLPGLIFLSRLQKEIAKEQADMNAQFAKGDLAKMVADVNRAGATLPDLDKLVRKLQEIAKGTRGGSAETEAFRKSLEAFINQLQTLSSQPNIELPITIPKGLLDGTFGAQAAKTTAAGFANQLKNENFGFGGFVASVNFEDQGTQAGKLFSLGWAKALKVGLKPAAASAVTDLALSVAQAGGNQNQELSILRQQETGQQDFLDALLKRPKTNKNVALATKAADNLKQTRNAIQAILDQRVSDEKQAAADAKTKAKEIKDASDKADQAVIDAFTPKQNRLDLRGIQVGQSDNLKAQLALQIAIANEASREIAIIDKTVKDKKTHDAEIAERVKTLATSGVNITGLLKQIGTQAKDRAAAAFQAIFDLDQARLQLAQLRVGPEGQGKDAVLAEFDKVIADAIKQKNAAKKGSLAQAQAQIQIQQFINDRRDFLNGLEKDAKETQGTTAFDLLTQFADTFNQNAGNLINQNQPFAGPTGFTADISQFLVRRPGAQAPSTAKADFTAPLVSSNAELIKVIRENTDAIRGNGGNAAAGVSAGVNAVGQRGKAMGEFWKAKQARDAAEARSGV